MYGKVMSISDEMMWRYYELLTDVQLADIEKMKRESHPMQAKKDLARRIVADFHSASAAAKAAEDWAKQFQDGDLPTVIELVQVKLDDVKTEQLPGEGMWQIRLDKLLHKAGFANSVSEAQRKLKQGSVQIGGEVKKEVWSSAKSLGPPFDIRVGRIVKKVHIVP
jgi:tyrosyl-tRNA synthetase